MRHFARLRYMTPLHDRPRQRVKIQHDCSAATPWLKTGKARAHVNMQNMRTMRLLSDVLCGSITFSIT
eukprot:2858887-Amphidinium_carterae.1